MHAFFKITEALAENKTLSSTAKLVLARLARHYNPKTGQCDPKVTTLARELGRHPNTIQDAIARLRQLGWIETHKGQRGLSFAIPREIPEADKGNTPILPHRNCVAENPAPQKLCSTLHRNCGAETAASLYEESQLIENVQDAAAVRNITVKHPDYQAAAASFPRNKSPNTNTNALAHALADELIAAHPQPGLPAKALKLVTKLLAQSENPEQTAATIRQNHPAWVTYWSGLYREQFIPQLWRWIQDGEWQNPPVMRKPPERKLFGQEAARDALEKCRARIG
jgi:hypothetical protein